MHPSDLIVCNHVVPSCQFPTYEMGEESAFCLQGQFLHGNLMSSIRNAYPVNPLSIQTNDNLCLAHGIFSYP